MKNKGKIFESQFKKSAQKEGLFVHRIRDNAMSYTQSESIYTHKNMCDFLIYKMPFLYAFELKHTTYPSIGIQTSPDEDEITYTRPQGVVNSNVSIDQTPLIQQTKILSDTLTSLKNSLSEQSQELKNDINTLNQYEKDFARFDHLSLPSSSI